MKIDLERVQYWLGQGAQATDRVARFLEAAGVTEKKARANPKAGQPGKAALERAKARADKAAGRRAAAEPPPSRPMAGPWIAVISADHAASAARDGFFACSHGDGRAAARPARATASPTTPRASVGEGDPVQAFVALGRILDDAPARG